MHIFGELTFRLEVSKGSEFMGSKQNRKVETGQLVPRGLYRNEIGCLGVVGLRVC